MKLAISSVRPDTCKRAKQAFVGLQVTNNSYSKFHFRDILGSLCCNVALAKSSGPSRGGAVAFNMRYAVDRSDVMHHANGTLLTCVYLSNGRGSLTDQLHRDCHRSVSRQAEIPQWMKVASHWP